MFRKRSANHHVTHLPIDREKRLAAALVMPERPKATRTERYIVALTLVLCWVGTGCLSWFVLIHKSLRLDESQSLWQSAHSIQGLLRAVATDVHVPLYHLLLHFWQMYLGQDIVTIRLLSLVFFLATIPFVYLLARYILSVRWSLLVMVLFSFSPFMNWYANEARMYTLLAFVTVVSHYFFLRILRYRRGWLGYTLALLFGIYTHYFFLFNLAAQGLFYLFNRKLFARGTFKRLFALALLAIAALAPWLWYFHLLGSASNTRPLLVRPSSVDFFNAFSQFFYGFQDNRINTVLISCWPLIMVVVFFAINRGQKLTKELNYILTLAFLPVVMAFGLSFVVQPFFLSRYLIAAMAPLTIVGVWLISFYGRTLATFSIIAVSSLLIFTSYRQDTSLDTPVLENYRQAAELIEQQARPQDVVAISTPFTIYPFEYYYNGSTQIKTLPLWDRKSAGSIPAFNASTLPAEVKQMSINHQELYLLLSYNQGYEKTIKQYFDTHYARTAMHHFSPDLNLYVYKVGYNDVPAIDALKS